MEDKSYLPIWVLLSILCCSFSWGGQSSYGGRSLSHNLSFLSITKNDLARDTSIRPDMQYYDQAYQATKKQAPFRPKQDSLALAEAANKAKKQTLRFTENIGQLDKSVRFHINDIQSDHYLMNKEIRTVLTQPGQKEKKDFRKQAKERKRGPRNRQEEQERAAAEENPDTTFSYGLQFLGTQGPRGIKKLQAEISKTVGKKNYFKGKNHFKDVPQYGQVRYEQLWKGIDADFYEVDGHLKYDFIIAPGGDPQQIKFQMDGVEGLSVDAKSGELRFRTPLGELRKGIPYTYQMIDSQRIEIKARYVVKGKVVSFQLGSYDPAHPLVIDPVALKFATFLGGNSTDYVYDIYVHPSSKKIYLTGETRSTSFPGLSETTSTNTNYDGFITCMSKDGSTVLWTTIIGGDDGTDYFEHIHVSDDEQDIFTSGYTRSNDYPTNGQLNPYAATQAGSRNPVITRLNGDGTILKYSTYFPVQSNNMHRYTVIGDLVYGATYYDRTDATNYPISLPAGAYISTPPSTTLQDGQLFFAINTAKEGEESLQYGTYFYDTTATAHSYFEFTDAAYDADGNIYFAGYMDSGGSSDAATGWYTANALQTIPEIQAALTVEGDYSPIGWVAQFDSTLSNLVYATPYLPVMQPDHLDFAGYDYQVNMEVNDDGDIYLTHTEYLYNAVLDQLSHAPAAKINNLKPYKIDRWDDLTLNVAAKISASDRTQFAYIVTAPADWYWWYTGGGVVDEQGSLHWTFSGNTYDAGLQPIATEGALQNTALTYDYYAQYVILDATGDLEYATVIASSLDLNTSSQDSYPQAIHVMADGTCYVGGYVDSDAQLSFPVTTSYWDEETSSQVFVYDATPANNTEMWLTVFHEPRPSDNTIQDFTAGNDSFCVDGLIYQDPNYGPILGDPIGYLSGDGSIAAHTLADIRPAPFTEAHPNPVGGDGLHWEISRDNGVTWTTLPGSNYEVYMPEPEVSAGTVQYRRVYTYGPDNTEVYSNLATATIFGNSTLDIQSPTEVVYFCPGTVEDFSFPIVGASDSIRWQWYSGFAPITNTEISPASGWDIAANFTATVPLSATNGGYYRLVVEEKDGCVGEAFVRILPLSDNAGSTATMAICPGDVTNSVILGPGVPNPDFEYSWTGPGGFTSLDPNPEVTLDGTYYLRVREVGDPAFCAGGETSVEVLPFAAHDPVLRDTNIVMTFCQDDPAIQIGLSGAAPSGYSFQWSPNIALDDATAFNPTFYPSTLPFGPPVSDINYVFSALRLSDGCIFEDTISVSITALAEPDAGDDKPLQCVNSYTAGNGSSGTYFEWRAVNTTFPGGLSALISDTAFSIDGAAVNLGTNKFAQLGFPYADTIIGNYTIEYELRSSYVPFPNDCYGIDFITLNVLGCDVADNFVCPGISTENVRGTNGICDLAGNILTASGLVDGQYEWTTYAVDGVLQPAGTAPRGLFEVSEGAKTIALAASGPHPTEVITDLEDPSWGWPGATSVEYQVTASIVYNDSLYQCSERIVVFSGVIGSPVVDLRSIDVCYAPSPGNLTVGNGVSLPYVVSGVDYNSAPNSTLVWNWSEGDILADEDTPFPTLNPATSTDYVVFAMDSQTGCYTRDTFNVTLKNVVADAGADITDACEGAVIQLGSTSRSNHAYQWTPGAGLNFPIGTPSDTVARPYLTVPSTPTQYILTTTELTTGCEAVDTVLVTPNTSAPAAPAAASYTSCAGGSLTIGALYNSSNGVTFSWTAGVGADISWLDNTTVNQPSVTLSSSFSGTATFRLTVTNGTCGSAFRDYTITESAADVALGPDVTAVCTSPLVQIGSSTQTASYNYSWSPTTGLYTDAAGTTPYTDQNTNTVYAQPNTNTTYTLFANRSSIGCIYSDQIVVNAPAGIDVDAGPDQILCPDETSVTLGQSGSGTISWTAIGYNSDPSGTPATPSAAESTTMMGYLSATNTAVVTFSHGTRAPGVYEYQVSTDYGGGCVATDVVEVVVSSVPTGLAGNNQTICSGSTATIGTTSVSGVSYSWSILSATAQSGTISNASIAKPTVNPQETTSYQLRYTDAVTGCTVTEVATVSVVAGPVLNDVSIGPICAPAAAQDLTAVIVGYGSLSSATWYTDYIGGPVVATPTAVSPSRNTDYYLVGYNANGCSDQAIVSVTVEDPATPVIVPSAAISCLADSIDLADYQGTPSDSNNAFEWHSDNTTNPATLLSSTVVDTGTYYLFEVSPGGCYSASDNIIITQEACPDCDGDGVWDFNDYCPCDPTTLGALNSYGCGFPDTCAFFVGDTITLDTLNANLMAGYITRYLLADTNGVIINISTIPEFTGFAAGKYMILAIDYEDDGSVANLNIGSPINTVAANCLDWSDALTIRICEDEICTDGIDNDGDGNIDYLDSDCDCPTVFSNALNLNFSNGVAITGSGLNLGDQILYSNVGLIGNQSVDIRATVTNLTNLSSLEQHGNISGGVMLPFANIAAGTLFSSTIQYEIFESGTTTPISSTFEIEILDLDLAPGNRREYITVPQADIARYTLYDPTNISTSFIGGNVEFSGTALQGGSDPEGALKLTYTDVNQFSITYGMEQVDNTVAGRAGYGLNGDNMRFFTDCFDEICNDGLDNDRDGLTDCDDPDCITDPAIVVSANNICPNDIIQVSASNLGPGTTYSWTFGSIASPSTASGIGPHDVSYDACGTDTIILTVTRNSCTLRDTAIINVIDNTAPTFTVPSDQTVYFNATCGIDYSPAVTGEVTDEADNCASNLDATYVDDLSGLTGCNNTGVVLRTWTLVDSCSNSLQQVQQITLRDTIAPVWTLNPADITVECDGTADPGGAISSWLAANGGGVATDACGTVSFTNDYTGLTATGCAGTGSATVTFTATDACGNFSTRSGVLTILDTTAPALTPVADITVDCDTIPAPIAPTVTDNCDPSVDLVYQEVRVQHPDQNWKSSGTCSQLYTVSDATYDDKGTASTADDEMTFVITVIGQNTGTGWSANVNGTLISGGYYQTYEFGPILSGGSVLNFTVVDDADPTCTLSVEVDMVNF